MASSKIVLRKNKKKSDGTCPLALRIIKDRKTRFIFLGHYILEKDWDSQLCKVKKSHPNSARLNNALIKKMAEASDMILETESSDESKSAKDIENKIKRSNKTVSFFELAKQRIDSYRGKGTYSVANAEQSIVNNIKKFIKGEELYFTDISTSFIEKYKTFCITKLGHKTRTVTNQLIFIRTMFNIALSENIVEQKYYPFAGEKEKIRIGKGLKIGLNIDEVKRIESLELEPDTQIWHARNVWLFSFYFAGIRISDVLEMTWGDIKDSRLWYVMNKNEKPISLKVPDKAKTILNNYHIDNCKLDDFIFPYLRDVKIDSQRDLFVKSRNGARLINDYLKRIADMCEIDKNLSNHIARHTFGNLAGDKIHPLMLQKLYRHSDLKTTINYQANFIHKEADEALDNVIGF